MHSLPLTRPGPWWLALLSVVLFNGCRTDEKVPPGGDTPSTEGTLRIQVVPLWEGNAFAPYTEYRAPHDYRFQVEFLRLYLSDMRLVGTNGEVVVDPVRLLDLDDGPFQLDVKVPAGTWNGVRVGLGLPPELNHTDPSLYGSEHPLSVNTGMSWNWANGYKFVLFDGRYNPDPQSTAPLLAPFSVHTGMDTCYKQVDLFPPLPFTTEANAVTNLTLRIDVDGFLQQGSDTIDVVTENQSHGGNLPLALKLTRNVANSMHMQ